MTLCFSFSPSSSRRSTSVHSLHTHTQLIVPVVSSYDEDDDDDLTHGTKTPQLQKRVFYVQQTRVDIHAYTHPQTDHPLSSCTDTNMISLRQ